MNSGVFHSYCFSYAILEATIKYLLNTASQEKLEKCLSQNLSTGIKSSSIHEPVPEAAYYLLSSFANLHHPENLLPINTVWLSESLLRTLSSSSKHQLLSPHSLLLLTTSLHPLLSLTSPTKATWLSLKVIQKREEGALDQ